MKKWFLIFVLIILTIFTGFSYWKKLALQPPLSNNKVLSAKEAPSPTPAVWPQSILLNINNVPIRISWTVVNPKNVELYDNLKEQKLSEEIKLNKSCSVLVNGGFYSRDYTHLGLFITGFKTLSGFSQNPTLNGFVSIDFADKVQISADLPNNNPRIALQTGPLLIQNNQPLPLAINNDEPSRRIVAGITNDNQLIFLVFYKDQANFEGPLLENLPKMVMLFEKQTGIRIVDAVNLDGGSASVFITNYDLLKELAIVGSYFCIK